MSRSTGRPRPGAPAWRLGGEGGGELFVEVEEVFEAVSFGVEAVASVAGVDGAVEGLVGAAEGRGHAQRIVQVGERSLPVRGSVG